jgi:hypothetical protein
MSTELKAIETRYKGYRFRSRLEARWAVFFDFLDIGWEYEPKGFTLSRWYLPDFRITKGQRVHWLEVKPIAATTDGACAEIAKELATVSGVPVVTVFGDPDTGCACRFCPKSERWSLWNADAIGLVFEFDLRSTWTASV